MKIDHSWILTYNSNWTDRNYNKRINNKQTFSVKLCSTCNIAYEITFNDYKKIAITHYYKDFPRIGLYKQICLKCKDKEKE